MAITFRGLCKDVGQEGLQFKPCLWNELHFGGIKVVKLENNVKTVINSKSTINWCKSPKKKPPMTLKAIQISSQYQCLFCFCINQTIWNILCPRMGITPLVDFLTVCKRLSCLYVVAGTSDSKNPELYYSLQIPTLSLRQLSNWTQPVLFSFTFILSEYYCGGSWRNNLKHLAFNIVGHYNFALIHILIPKNGLFISLSLFLFLSIYADSLSLLFTFVHYSSLSLFFQGKTLLYEEAVIVDNV